MPRSTKPRKLPAESAARTEWLKRARKLSAQDRLPLIERTLRKLPKTPTVKNVYWRKTLLRLLDASRLESGLVSPADLQQENSPFAAMNFRTPESVSVRVSVPEQTQPEDFDPIFSQDVVIETATRNLGPRPFIPKSPTAN